MRDGSAPVGVNHMAVRKFKRSFFPRVTTRAGIRIEKGLLPWLPASKSLGAFQFICFSKKPPIAYHGLMQSAMAETGLTTCARLDIGNAKKSRQSREFRSCEKWQPEEICWMLY